MLLSSSDTGLLVRVCSVPSPEKCAQFVITATLQAMGMAPLPVVPRLPSPPQVMSNSMPTRKRKLLDIKEEPDVESSGSEAELEARLLAELERIRTKRARKAARDAEKAEA